MTKSQMARFTELMKRDFNVSNLSGAIAQPLSSATLLTRNVDEFLDRFEVEQNIRLARHEDNMLALIGRRVDRVTLFRFAYVPFVIAELVWDYADTVMSIGATCGAPKRLCRAIKNARREYDSTRRQFISNAARQREIDNMYIFEDGVKRIADQMLLNIKLDIKSEYPDLLPDHANLLIATYQCHVLSRALLKYNRRQCDKVASMLRLEVADVLPLSYHTMDRLITEYIGNKPASDRLKSLLGQYITTMATQIGLIQLNETDNHKFD